jgi:glycosyltransferase involved in cell wall biosynthesis
VRALLADRATTEVVVAIDGSGDGSYELAARLARTDSRVVAFEQDHTGREAARSSGVRRANGEIVLLVDDDVVAGKDLVTGHARHHRQAEEVVVLGYMPVVTAEEDSATRVFARIYEHEYESHCREIEADPTLVLLRLWGGNVSMRRANWLSLDTEPWGDNHEDQFFGIRCYRAGLHGIFDRTLYAEHRYSRGPETFLQSARGRGLAKWRLHSMFPELLGPLDPDWASAGLPAIADRLVRWGATPGRSRYLTKPLVMTARSAHRVRLESAESVAYRLARRVELQTGSRCAVASRSFERAS